MTVNIVPLQFKKYGTEYLVHCFAALRRGENESQ